MPGSVVPGPFGSFPFGWVGVGVVFGKAVPDGLWLVDAETVGEFGPLAVVGPIAEARELHGRKRRLRSEILQSMRIRSRAAIQQLMSDQT
jgi:hypothetical protein